MERRSRRKRPTNWLLPDVLAAEGQAGTSDEVRFRHTRSLRVSNNDAKARYGRLDVVVANAVVDAHAPLAKITEEQFDTMLRTNLKQAGCR
jgi:NAD(P)-dependent dehydrogenase (short-subunit alcohol dehydrogenase family)